MSASERRVTPADIMELGEYTAKRKELRKELVAMKRDRRLEVGPFATFYFENYETMWAQIMEMLYIEKGGAEQITGELDAYNPLIPQGSELIATLMLEIESPEQRTRELYRLAGIEEAVFIELGGKHITACPTEYDERTTADGKTSSVHWVRFPFTEEDKKRFTNPSVQAVLGVSHPAYGHMAVIPPEARAALARDFA
jgi:hypothetical protein